MTVSAPACTQGPAGSVLGGKASKLQGTALLAPDPDELALQKDYF